MDNVILPDHPTLDIEPQRHIDTALGLLQSRVDVGEYDTNLQIPTYIEAAYVLTLRQGTAKLRGDAKAVSELELTINELVSKALGIITESHDAGQLDIELYNYSVLRLAQLKEEQLRADAVSELLSAR